MAFSQLGRALDVEWFLKRDQSRPSADVEDSHRRLIGSDRSLSSAFEAWLQGRRTEVQHQTLGTRVAELLTGAHLLLIFASLLAGSATAEALLLSGDPQNPTNVLNFLLATLAWPFVFLSFSLLWIGVRGKVGGSILLGELYATLVGVLARVGQRANQENWSIAQEWRSVRRQHQRYRQVEFATFASASQWYALCFHLAAALSLLRSALFSDLTFAWSTTAQALEWDMLATFFAVSTAPWCQTTGWACVSSELVRATEFVRFTGQYAEPNGAALSGAWWSPLFLTLLAYGVLPRLAVALFFARRVARYDRELGERHIELRRRLVKGVSVNRQRAPGIPDGAAPAPELLTAAGDVSSVTQGPCWLIGWRGAELEPGHSEQQAAEFGYRIHRRVAAGSAEFEQDEALLLELRSSSSEPVLLVVDAWEAPDKATRRFIRGIRQSGTPERPIYVIVASGMQAVSSETLHTWRDRLALLEDPFLSVQSAKPPVTIEPPTSEQRL